jgi:mRNA interferase RelE/StbE
LAWTIEFSRAAEKSLLGTDHATRKRIARFIDEKLENSADPRLLGKPLQGVLKEFWSYRIGDYRLICDIQDKRMVVLVIDIGHRREIYR